MAAPQQDPEIARVGRMARILDTFGVDPLLGFLLPGVGDLAGTALGLYAVALAVKRRMSPIIIARMLLNLTVDAALGAIPILGDVGDFVFRANRRNVALLESRAATGGRASWKDWLAVVGAALLLIGTMVLSLYLLGRLIAWIF